MSDKTSVTTYLENEYFILKYDHDNDILLPKWNLTTTPGEFKEAMLAVIAALKHFKTSRVVWDTRQLGAILYDVQQWVATDWLREAIESGYAYAAFVVPEDIFTKMSVEDTVEMGTVNMAGVRKTKYFDNMPSALRWIGERRDP